MYKLGTISDMTEQCDGASWKVKLTVLGYSVSLLREVDVEKEDAALVVRVGRACVQERNRW